MQKIYTRLFRLDGLLQLGFLNIKGETLRDMRELPGLRFYPAFSLWHIDYYIGCLKKLNGRFAGRYIFIGDSTEIAKIPNAKSDPKRELKVQVSLSEQSDHMYVRHTYHKGLFKAIQVLNGSSYDPARGYWTMRKGKNYDYIKKAAEHYGFEFKILSREAASKNSRSTELEQEHDPDRAVNQEPELNRLESGSGTQYLGKEELSLLRVFEQELVLKNRSPRTLDSYLCYARQFLQHFNGQDLRELSIQRIREYFSDLLIGQEYSYSTINLHISAVRGLLTSNFNRDLPGIDIPRPKAAKLLPKVLSKAEVQRMIESSYNDKHRLIITMLYSTGMRRSEIIGLRLRDINLDSNRIRIRGKGEKDRTAFISMSLRKHLVVYIKARKPADYLFAGQSGGPYSATSVEKIIKAAAHRAKIEKNVSPHMLRHSFATHLISAGVGLPHVQKLLGHSSIKTTMIYTHIADNDLQNLPNPLDDMDL